MTLQNTKILMILAHFEFRDEEYEKPRKAFEEEGAKVYVASSSEHMAHGLHGLQVQPDMDLSDIHVRDYDAVVFVGGPGIQEYYHNGSIQRIITDCHDYRILIAATSQSPVLLANAGILANRKVTSSNEEKHNIEAAGAFFTGRVVEQDGELITASGPDVAEEFGKAIVKAVAWKKDRKGYLV